jgi:N-acetylglucosamine repressor
MKILGIDKENLPGGSEAKKLNLKKDLLRYLYHDEILSTPELCKLTGMSSPTITYMLLELAESGFVVDKGQGLSSGGRKPNLYGLIADSAFVLSMHSDIYSTTLAIYNFHNQLVAGPKHIEVDLNDDLLFEILYSNSIDLISATGIDVNKIVGIGIDLPGLIDAETGINHTITNPANNNIIDGLTLKFNIPVYIENDARMQAFGEFIFGKAKGYKNAIVINIKWGIGLGMIIDGKLYSGHKGFAGEFSHIQLEDEGALCKCGKRGCLQTTASLTYLMQSAKQGILEGKISQLTEKFADNMDSLQPIDVVTAAKSGDMFAIQLLSKIGFTLGKGIAILIQLLNPEIIILGGPISSARQYLLAPIQQAINRYCLEKISNNAKIEISEIDEDEAGLLGTTAMVFDKLLSEKY